MYLTLMLLLHFILYCVLSHIPFIGRTERERGRWVSILSVKGKCIKTSIGITFLKSEISFILSSWHFWQTMNGQILIITNKHNLYQQHNRVFPHQVGKCHSQN